MEPENLDTHKRTEGNPTDQVETYQTRDWNDENVLQVYPRTFNEVRHQGEPPLGVGSILGITEKLDFMQSTGITAVWLGPIYKSPGLDGNYDITDYRQIDPELGNLDDVKELIAKAHEHDIRIIFDLVPNHTSDQSEWFKASCDPNNPEHETYKDYYIWHDPIKGTVPPNIVADDRLTGLPDGLTVPNNWSSIFSLPQIDEVRNQHHGNLPEGTEIPAVTAWVWNDVRQQFYLAEFMKEQPSLNWSNDAVREEIKSVVRYWLDLGVDSFRVDVMNHIGKDRQFRDEEPAQLGTAIGEYNPGVTNPHDQWKQEKLVSHWPELGECVNDLVSVLDEDAYKDKNIRFIFEDWMSALGSDDRLDKIRPDKATVFNFEMLLNTNRDEWSAENVGRIIQDYYNRMQLLEGAVPNQVSGNHDTDTLRTRLESGKTMRAAYLMLALLPGALYTWQGDLLGRANAIIPKELQKDGEIGKRDGERIPMQWDNSQNGGFSRAPFEKLWLPSVDPKVYEEDNIDKQAQSPDSPYSFIATVLHRRKDDPALRSGALRMLHTDHTNVLAFAREDPVDPRRQVISVTNFSPGTVVVNIHDARQMHGVLTLSSLHGYENEETTINLNEALTLPPDASYVIDSTS